MAPNDWSASNAIRRGTLLSNGIQRYYEYYTITTFTQGLYKLYISVRKECVQ